MKHFASFVVMADPAFFPIPETDCDCLSSIWDNECDVAPKAFLFSKQRVNFVLKRLNKFCDAIRLEPHGDTTRKHDICLLAESDADSGARWARFRNHPGQHSEMNSGTIPG
jgi:hypothetical protein